MKKVIVFCLMLLILCTAGCSTTNDPAVTQAPAATPQPTPATELERTLGDFQLLLVNGGLYYNTGAKTSALYGSPDATIATSRYPGNVPYKENQSNFGAGYEYYFDGSNGLSVSIDGTWWRFRRVTPVNFWGLELYAENVTTKGADVVCNRFDSEVTETIEALPGITLEQWTETGWSSVDGRMHIMDMDWGAERLAIEPGGTLRWTVDWTPFYHELTPGSYRLYKQFQYIGSDGMEYAGNLYARFEITEDTPVQAISDNRWGVEMTAADVTPSGLTLTITRGDSSDWEMITGEDYILEVLQDDTWVAYERSDGILIDFGWNSIAYLVTAATPLTMEIDWEWLHGTLPAGQYRITKEFIASQPSDCDPPNDKFTLSAEFRIGA